MLRNIMLKIVAPVALAVCGVPAIASAHSHVDVRFGFGFGGYCYQPVYCAPAYVAPAPAVVYTPVPAAVVVTPPVVYSQAAVVVTPVPAPAPVVVVTPAPAPVVVYSSGWCYPHRVIYDHVRWYRR
jgi:hypothetical protein